MALALRLAGRALGTVWPNPAVGCVLVKDGAVVGRGWTQAGGRPHAETIAIERAGTAARGATAYVTLEPCAHHGETAPCADALIAAGVGRVVVAMGDPDARVDGAGLGRLRVAGIDTEEGLLGDVAAELQRGFVLRVTERRPLVTLKTASSADGAIATASGESRWITGDAARARAHLLRARHDAILIGIGTALADDPALTCRLPGLETQSPVRIVLDSRLRLPPSSKLARSAAQTPLWVVAVEGADVRARSPLEELGATVIQVAPSEEGRLDLRAMLHELAARGITRLLVEGGHTVATALLAGGTVDRVVWFRAASVMGGDAVAAFGALGIAAPKDAVALDRLSVEPAGEDVLETYAVRT